MAVGVLLIVLRVQLVRLISKLRHLTLSDKAPCRAASRQGAVHRERASLDAGRAQPAQAEPKHALDNAISARASAGTPGAAPPLVTVTAAVATSGSCATRTSQPLAPRPAPVQSPASAKPLQLTSKAGCGRGRASSRSSTHGTADPDCSISPAGGSAAAAPAKPSGSPPAASGGGRARHDGLRAAQARSQALHAKLAGHPMSSLAHYNRAMELTRAMCSASPKNLVYPCAYPCPYPYPYPSPYARGRSAYKIPAGEPEDAPDGWREYVGQAVVAAAAEYGSGGGEAAAALQLDAAYLRRGCILLVVEYSRRRTRQRRWGRPSFDVDGGADDGGANGAAGSAGGGRSSSGGSDDGSGDGGLEAWGSGGESLLAAPVLSYTSLLRAFGPQLQRPEGGGGGAPLGGVEAQHFWGPTGGDALFKHEAFAATDGSAACTATAAAAIPCLLLLGPPCVLTSHQQLYFHVLALGAAATGSGNGSDDKTDNSDSAPLGGPARRLQNGAAAAPAAAAAPRLLARYGCLDAAPQPCCVLMRPGEGAWEREGGATRRERQDPRGAASGQAVAGDAGGLLLLHPGDVVGAPLGLSEHDDLGVGRRGGVGRTGGPEAAAAGGSSAGACGLELCVVAGPCPSPGLLLLEMEVQAGPHDSATAVAEAKPPGHPIGSATAAPPMLSAPLPVVVVDDPKVQAEVNQVAAAATSSLLAARAAAADATAATAAAMAVTPPTTPPPAWLLSFLYDLGQFLELSGLLAARRQLTAAPQACTFAPAPSPAQGAGVACATNGNNSRYTGNWEDREDGVGTAAAAGSDSDSDWSVYDSGSDGGGAAAALASAKRGNDAAHLACLAAGLASYACRQGLPALLSAVLRRAASAGVALTAVDEEAGCLSGGLGLGHLAVLSGSAEVVTALLLQARNNAGGGRGGAASSSSSSASGGGSWFAGLNACTALFVRPGPGGVTALHLAALVYGSCCQGGSSAVAAEAAAMTEALLSLCPMAAHAWFGVRDGGGSSAAQYAMQAGAGDLNLQCEEQLVMELVEAEALGCPDPGAALVGALTAVMRLEAAPSAAGQLADGGVTTARDEQTEAERREVLGAAAATAERHGGNGEASADAGRAGGGSIAAAVTQQPAVTSSSSRDGRPCQADNPAAADTVGSAPAAPPAGAPLASSSRPQQPAPLPDGAGVGALPAPPAGRGTPGSAFGPKVGGLRRLPWKAPLRGFADPALERTFAARSAALALQRNRLTLAFYVLMLAGCVRKAQVALSPARQSPGGGGAIAVLMEFFVAIGPPLIKLHAAGAVAALRLTGAAHDVALAAADVVRGVVVGGCHLAGRPHPEAFEVADLAMQEALATLFHCVIQPVMEQIGSPLISLVAAAACSLMEWPMLLTHGWRGQAAACLLLGRFLAGLAVRYCLAVWARASFLKGAARRRAAAAAAGEAAGTGAAAGAGCGSGDAAVREEEGQERVVGCKGTAPSAAAGMMGVAAAAGEGKTAV